MKKILLVLSLLGLFDGWIEKSNEKEKTEISSVDFKEAEIYYNRGSNKYKLNDYEGAMLDFNKAIKLDPKYALTYYNRGVVKNELKQYKEAIELDSEYAKAYYNRGLARYKLKNYIGANSDFKKANELNPELKNPYKD